MRRNQKPLMAPIESMSTPDMTTDSATEVSRDSGSEDSHDEIEQLYSRLVRVGDTKPESAKTAANDLDVQFPKHSLRGCHNVDRFDDPKALLASMDRAQSSPTPNSTDEDDGDPRRMLAEMEKSAPGPAREQIENDPKLILAELDRELSSSRRNTSSGEHDLNELRRKIRDSSALSDGDSGTSPRDVMVLISRPQNATGGTINESASSLPQICIAHAIKPILEGADSGWGVARDCTTFLYSSGLDGYSAQAAKNALVKQATQDLANIIQNVTEMEKRHSLAEEKERLPCRLIISNLAAGAEEEDIMFFFRSHEYDIRDLRFLEIRDAVKRTKRVQLDMWTRRAAVRASYMHGSIFGLNLDIELAVATVE